MAYQVRSILPVLLTVLAWPAGVLADSRAVEEIRDVPSTTAPFSIEPSPAKK